jgi:hypothetical protein
VLADRVAEVCTTSCGCVAAKATPPGKAVAAARRAEFFKKSLLDFIFFIQILKGEVSTIAIHGMVSNQISRTFVQQPYSLTGKLLKKTSG